MPQRRHISLELARAPGSGKRPKQAPRIPCSTPDCGTILSAYRPLKTTYPPSWEDTCAGCRDREIVSGTSRDYRRQARKLLAVAGYQEVRSDDPHRQTGGQGSKHLVYENEFGQRIVQASTPGNNHAALRQIEQDIAKHTREREPQKEGIMQKSEVALTPEETDLNVRLFVDYLCDLYGVGGYEAKTLRLRVGAEVRVWMEREKMTHPSHDAMIQAIRTRSRRPGARLVTLESGRGNKPSTVEIRGKRYSERQDNGKPDITPEQVEVTYETPLCGAVGPNGEKCDDFAGHVGGHTSVSGIWYDQPEVEEDSGEPAKVTAAEERGVTPTEVPPALREPLPIGDLLTQIAALQEAAKRTGEAEAKAELALELLDDIEGRVTELCTMCSTIVTQIREARSSLR